MGKLDGKVALVTGGGSGIGAATALRFAGEGAAVCCADLDLDNAASVVKQIEADGGRALAVQVDTSDEAQCEEMVAACVASLGAVDVLMASAGIGSAVPPAEMQQLVTRNGGFGVLDYPIERFQRVIDVNFYGVLHSDRAVARWQRENQRKGSLINVASVAARIPLPGGAYSVSKAAVWMLTKVLAMELAPLGIRVNAIGPGYIDTPMTAAGQQDETRLQGMLTRTPMGRLGVPEEVAATALFLASDDASYFTGELLHPAGGIFHD